MKQNVLALFGLLAIAPMGTMAQEMAQEEKFTVEISNPWNKPKADEPVVICLSEVNPAFRVRSAVVMAGDKEIASQLDDLNGDLKADELAFVIDLPAKGKQTVSVTLSSAKSDKKYTPRVYATLLAREAKNNRHAPVQSITVPGTTNFYSMVHGHGPMFESELVGYRVYFNQKQTIDPYGKFHKRLEIEKSGFYPNDQQLKEGYGDDVLLVGNSGGIGALKGWDGQKATHIEPIAFRTECVRAAGPIRTIADVEVKGWEYQGKELTMTNRYILYAGHRDLRIEAFFSEPLEDEVFVAGVQNIMGTETVMDSDHKGLVGSWGRHWPVNDTVKYAKETIGIATYIPQKYVINEVADKDNFLYTVGNKGQLGFHYYTMFTSRKETFGYPDSKSWFAYMKEWKEGLEKATEVKIIKK